MALGRSYLDFLISVILFITLMEDNMAHDTSANEHHHSPSYGYNILIWLTLLSLTCVTVAVAGLDLGPYILLTAMVVAAIKSALVINIFMHIKFDDPIFKVFFTLIIFTLIVLFVLTASDVFYR